MILQTIMFLPDAAENFYLTMIPLAATGMALNFRFWFNAGLQASAIMNMRGDGTAIVITAVSTFVAHGPFGEKQRDDVTFTEYGEFATNPMAKSPL